MLVFQPEAWLNLLEDTMLGNGWTRADPAVPGVLRGPDGILLNGSADVDPSSVLTRGDAIRVIGAITADLRLPSTSVSARSTAAS
jgi:hypothetical protein